MIYTYIQYNMYIYIYVYNVCVLFSGVLFSLLWQVGGHADVIQVVGERGSHHGEPSIVRKGASHGARRRPAVARARNGRFAVGSL